MGISMTRASSSEGQTLPGSAPVASTSSPQHRLQLVQTSPGIFSHLYLIGNVWHSTAEGNSSGGFGDESKSLQPLPTPQHIRMLSHTACESCSVVSDTLQPCGLLCPWDSPGKNTGVDSHSLLQGIFPSQGSNPGLPHCRQILYCLNHQGSPSRTAL